MTISRRSFVATALAAPAIMMVTRGNAQEFTLRVHHFMAGVAPGHTEFLVPWGEKITADSGGRIAVEVYPSMQLGGAPAQLFDQARDGVVDAVWTLPSYTAGRFPKSEAFELPFIAAREARINSAAFQDFADAHLADEFSEVHPVCFWAHDRGVIHANRPVASQADLAGLRLRFSTRLAGEALTALGASPVGMPAPQIPESIASGVLDGALIPWEIVPSIKLHELVSNHIDFPEGKSLYTATFLLAMNKGLYERLPDDLRGVIDANSGQAASAMAAAMFDGVAPKVEALAKERGNSVTVLDPAEVANWEAATAPVIDNWIASSQAAGFDGAALVEDVRARIAQYAKA